MPQIIASHKALFVGAAGSLVCFDFDCLRCIGGFAAS